MIAHCPKCGRFAHEGGEHTEVVHEGRWIWKHHYRYTEHWFHCSRCHLSFSRTTEERLR